MTTLAENIPESLLHVTLYPLWDFQVGPIMAILQKRKLTLRELSKLPQTTPQS